MHVVFAIIQRLLTDVESEPYEARALCKPSCCKTWLWLGALMISYSASFPRMQLNLSSKEFAHQILVQQNWFIRQHAHCTQSTDGRAVQLFLRATGVLRKQAKISRNRPLNPVRRAARGMMWLPFRTTSKSALSLLAVTLQIALSMAAYHDVGNMSSR